MNIVLWILQILLAVKLFSVAYSHGVNPGKQEMQEAIDKMGAQARPVLAGISSLSILSAAGLILPVIIEYEKWLLPVVAVIISVMMLGALIFHKKYRENPKSYASLVLFFIAAFIVYGRWCIVPL
ncbi:MAG: DoxX family protein [Calditrichaceae bacterium]|jgi:hypothetical protein